MRRSIKIPFLGLVLFLFCWMNLPKAASDRIRSSAVSLFRRHFSENPGNELAKLQWENQKLRFQIDHAYEWLLFEQRNQEQFEFLKVLEQKPQCQKKATHLRETLKSQLSALPAQVIYRDPNSWSSSLWVNVGEENNLALGYEIVAKNSPVLADGALVGVIDYVGKKQARVRLITDSGLSPAVRVCRGASQQRELGHQIQALLNLLEKRDDAKDLITQLSHLKEKTALEWEDGYLAKGEVHGSSAPFWRSRGPLLKGIGFNFDYPDEEGLNRDLKGSVPIIKEGDLLVTSGLDGVFPSGLRVGTVLSVAALKEGAYCYDIEVRPAVHHLNDLQTLFVLPAQGE